MNQDHTFIWKVTVNSLGGTESQGISRVGENSVSQVDGVSDMAPACQLCDSVGGGLRKGTMAIAHLFVWEKAVPYPHSHLDTRPFSSSLYATGAFQAAPQVLERRWTESE